MPQSMETDVLQVIRNPLEQNNVWREETPSGQKTKRDQSLERSLNMLNIHLINFNSVVGKQINRYAFTKLSNIVMYYEI